MAHFTSPTRLAAIAMVAALALGGCYQTADLTGGASVPQLQAEQEKQRNNALVSNMRTLQMAIEQYAVDHNGQYPESGAWLKGLTGEAARGAFYLPEDRLSANPWAPAGLAAHQLNELGTAGLQPVLAPAGATPTAIGTALGAGQVAASGTYDATTYGALIYDHDRRSGIYTLYAIGKHGDRAVVVGSATNMP